MQDLENILAKFEEIVTAPAPFRESHIAAPAPFIAAAAPFIQKIATQEWRLAQ